MERAYEGRELESFAHARRWKAYVARMLGPYLQGAVLEAGAGLGETTRALRPASAAVSWTCLEPDALMARTISDAARAGALGADVGSVCGTIVDLPGEPAYDTVLYVDVLEHIADDHAELAEAARRLRPCGRIVVLSPAWPFLYSEFDKAIGHHRRYTKRMLRALTPDGTMIETAFYLDAVGMLASAANKLLLRQRLPTLRQVLLWDRAMVPLSRLLDPLTGRSFGRSVVTVWRKD